MSESHTAATEAAKPDVHPQDPGQEQWCMCWVPSHPTVEGAERAALTKHLRWLPGEIIHIAFLDGDPTVQERVQAAAEEWIAPGMANLQFAWETDPKRAQIRISFQYSGSWSVIGTACRQRPYPQPTMNYGWLKPTSSDEELRRVVLHEFGHALGLIHEHQNPDPANPIPWNRAKVIADLSGPPNNWDGPTIEHNMFKPADLRDTAYTVRDDKSIMMYPFPASWTTNGLSIGLNSELSTMDRDFIHEAYP